MRHAVLPALLLFLPVLSLWSQGIPDTVPPLTTLYASTQRVVVNVTVRDRTGKPVAGLAQSSFEVREDNVPEAVRSFSEQRPETTGTQGAGQATQPPRLPPGVFTDLAPAPARGPLNILLLDSLNTPINDQAYLRSQLLEYVAHMKPGTNVAIFGLASRLYLLQGFSSSPDVLRRALSHALPSPSTLLPATADSNTSATTGAEAVADSAGTTPPSPGGPSQGSQILDTAAVLGQFETDNEAYQTQVRIQTTVDGFNALAHYLGAMPGRKNLLWFSGSFPLTLLPDPTAGSQATSTFLVNELVKNTTAMLAKAQVAIYPIDARGLLVNPAYDAARSGERYGRNPTAFAQDLARFQSGLAQEHGTELTIAEESGGHAFFNTNSLAAAASAAIDDGSSYYVLEYRPPDREAKADAYRRIAVTLKGPAAAAGYTLEYRRGYYTGDSPSSALKAGQSGPQLTDPADIYARTAMSRGAPTPSEVLFTASVLPASATPETTLATDVRSDPAHKVAPPFHRFHVTFALMPGDLRLVPQESGRHTGRLAFLVFLYSSEGQLLLSNGRDLTFNFDPAAYKAFLQSPIRLTLDMDAPVQGSSYLRLGVHDLEANHFGVVEIPVASLPSTPAAHP